MYLLVSMVRTNVWVVKGENSGFFDSDPERGGGSEGSSSLCGNKVGRGRRFQISHCVRSDMAGERDNEETPGEKWGGIAGCGQEGSRVGMGAIGGGITRLSDSECNKGGYQSSARLREFCLSLQVCKARLGVMRRTCQCGRRRRRRRCSCHASLGDRF